MYSPGQIKGAIRIIIAGRPGMAFTVWWKSMSGRKQESERSRMEIADTEAAVPRAARPKPNSTALDCDTSPRTALNPWRRRPRPVL